MSLKSTKTISANRFEVKDKNNKTRIILDASGPLGYATVTLFADNGVSIALTVNPDNSSSLSVFRPDGTSAAGLGIKANGDAGVSLHDSVGRITTLLAAPTVPAAKTLKGKKGGRQN